MTLQEIFRPVRDELAIVERRLVEPSEPENKVVSQVVSQVLNAGGKRLRPALLLIAAKACDCTGERVIKLATAVELIHTASLIHDDVIDSADLRRGAPTVNSRWGNEISVLVGDHLYAKAVGIVAEDGGEEVMRTVTAAVSKMTAGEMAQTLRRHDVDVTEEEYLSIIAGKTASLIHCSCRVGAAVSESGNGLVDILSDYGVNLGMAFQITDDLLDLTGQKESLGKPLGNDIREGRLTLPFIHAMRAARGKDRRWMADAFRSGLIDEDTLSHMRNMVEQYGGVEYSVAKAKTYDAACKGALRSLRDSEIRTSLAMLADYVVERVC